MEREPVLLQLCHAAVHVLRLSVYHLLSSMKPRIPPQRAPSRTSTKLITLDRDVLCLGRRICTPTLLSAAVAYTSGFGHVRISVGGQRNHASVGGEANVLTCFCVLRDTQDFYVQACYSHRKEMRTIEHLPFKSQHRVDTIDGAAIVPGEQKTKTSGEVVSPRPRSIGRLNLQKGEAVYVSFKPR